MAILLCTQEKSHISVIIVTSLLQQGPLKSACFDIYSRSCRRQLRDKRHQKNYHVTTHIEIHSGEKPFKCNELHLHSSNCRRQFTYYVIIFLSSQTEFCNQRSPQLVVAEGHNIFKVTGTHICGQRPPHFLVPEEHQIL